MVAMRFVRFAQPTVMSQTLTCSGTTSRLMHFGRGLFIYNFCFCYFFLVSLKEVPV